LGFFAVDRASPLSGYQAMQKPQDFIIFKRNCANCLIMAMAASLLVSVIESLCHVQVGNSLGSGNGLQTHINITTQNHNEGKVPIKTLEVRF